MVVFPDAGELGLEFEEVRNNETGELRVSIKHIRSNTPASRHPGLRPGLLLDAVNKVSQLGREWDDVVAQLGSRPLEMVFVPPSLPGAADTAMRVAQAKRALLEHQVVPAPSAQPAPRQHPAVEVDVVERIQSRLKNERLGIQHQQYETRQQLHELEQQISRLSFADNAPPAVPVGGTTEAGEAFTGAADDAVVIPRDHLLRDQFFTAHGYLVGKIHGFMRQMSTLDVAAVCLHSA